ncbi:carbohydrate ABC transporter permease [Treponema zuelzerae]|uniref:Carbohydrate ABC transporter permease n=1 Tax=Teretinema zuelzerae TaxID=156 RepID=A0AAE3EKA6_9SPIR|nr:carbohydrate ABC transporter permease [Teretinema zuelzerae]MCD1655043.1 carbohydrate ABC transporter permease [Teretinema zuelzerae]
MIASKRHYEERIFTSLNTAFMIAFSVLMLYPFWNTVAVSFNEAVDTVRGGVTLYPRRFTLQNYKMVFSTGTIFHAFFVSVARTSINMFVNVFLTAMIAYVLSRPNFMFRKPFTMILVISMYINAGLIPTYFLIKNLGLLNSFWVYVIPGMVNAFNFLVIRTYLKTIPESVIESVRMDGGGDLKIFFSMIIPLSMPVLATVGLFVAVGSWNSWFDTLIYASSKVNLHTLQYKLMEYLQSSQSQARSSGEVGAMALAKTSSLVTPVSIRAAITVIASAPILFIYPFMQRYFVVGVNIGGVKE